MNDENSVLVDGKVVPVSDQAAAEWPLFAGQNWFKPSASSLQRAMVSLIESSYPSLALRREIAMQLINNFSTDVIGRQMSERITFLRAEALKAT